MDAFRGAPETIDMYNDTDLTTQALLYPPAIRHETGTGTIVEINQVAA